MKNSIIGFMCGVIITGVVCLGILYFTGSFEVKNEVVKNEVVNKEVVKNEKEDIHLSRNVKLQLRETAEAIDKEEILYKDKINQFYKDAKWMPDWGYYTGDELDEEVKTERTYNRHKSFSVDFYYNIEDSNDVTKITKYLRILKYLGYKLTATSEDLIVYEKDELYIRLSQPDDSARNRICVSASDSGFGV